MKITLHQLQVFEKVAKMGSVTLAAHALHMTQPAVSNIIRQLEDSYGCQLTEVIGKKLYLTAFGKELLCGCHELQSVLANTETRLQMLKGGVTGTLTIATVSTAKYFVPHLLGAFKAEYANVHFKLKVCNREEVIARLEANEDDFVIMSQPPNMISVDCADFYQDELVVAASANHPLKNKSTLTLKSLAQEPWIIREPGSGTRIAMLKIMNNYKIFPNIEMEISNNEAIKQAIIANIGISILSKQSIDMELKNKLLCLLPVENFPIPHKWYLVKNKGKQLSPIAEKFYAFVKEKQGRFSELY